MTGRKKERKAERQEKKRERKNVYMHDQQIFAKQN